MFKDVVDSIFKFDKIPNRLFFAGIVFGVLYLYEPFSWIFDFPVTFKPYVKIGFVICLVMFLMNLFFWITKGIHNQIKIFRFKRNFKEIYRNLDYYERNVIREFYLLGKSTLAFPYFETVIQGLADKNVLVNATSFSAGYIIDGITASYRLNKYIIPFINPASDFDLPKNNSKEELERVARTRPHWLQDRF